MDFNKILEHYNIGRHKAHKHIWWALANTVYVLTTTKGKYVLKIFEESEFENSDPDYIKFQVKVMNLAQRKKLPVPKIIRTKTRRALLVFNNKRILIHRFIPGKELEKPNNKLIKDIAHKMALLDKALMRLKLRGKYVWPTGRN